MKRLALKYCAMHAPTEHEGEHAHQDKPTNRYNAVRVEEEERERKERSRREMEQLHVAGVGR